MRGRFFPLIDFGRRPDSRSDVAFGARFVQPVIDRNEFAVRPLHGPRIANVRFARAAAQNVLRSPRRAVIIAQYRTDGVRFVAIGIGNANLVFPAARGSRG